METILYVDSRQRDTTLFPNGNSYTLFLQTPIRNVTQVDLVSAKIPNTVYNLTESNVLQVNSSNVVLNPGFYSTCSLVSTFNNSSQFSNVSMDYLEPEGRFIFYGNVVSVTCQTQEVADLVGLPIGTTTSTPMLTNIVYNGLYHGSNAYVKSSRIVSLEMNDYIWLDIEEFRTSGTSDARKLVLSPQGQYTTTGDTAARSFALIPMDVASGGIKAFKEASDYPVRIVFPSRLDSLDRLTIQWLDRNGVPLDFRGLDANAFTLRVHTIHVPDTPERPESLPPPVPYEMEKKKIFIGAVTALILGLLFIVLAGKKR
jgi:hypothetical protein